MNAPEITQLLGSLRLPGMEQALQRQWEDPASSGQGFEERLGLLLSAEQQFRDARKLDRLVKAAKLPIPVSPEMLSYRQGRGLLRPRMKTLFTLEWAVRGQSMAVTGPTGAGKSFLASAFGLQACRMGHSVLYRGTDQLLQEIALARADDLFRLAKLEARLRKVGLLILDDWLLEPASDADSKDLLRLVMDRIHDDPQKRRPLLIASQIPPEGWHDRIRDKAIADSICDRLNHTIIRIDLQGESMRKLQAQGGAL